MDTVVNSREIGLIELCRMCNLHIVNGRVGSDKGVGHYTCYTYNVTSCVDYVLCSAALMPFIHNFDVLECTPYHCPIHWSILVDSHCHQREQERTISKLVWDNDKIDTYCQNQDNISVSKFQGMIDMIEHYDENVDISVIVNEVVKCFNDGV